MQHQRSSIRSLLATTAIAVIVSAVAIVQAVGADSGVVPAHDPVDLERIEWAHERFDDAGLQLDDDIVITFHTDREACEGNLATFRTRATTGDHDRVRICRTSDGSATEERLVRHALLHELSHAWAHHSLGDHARRAFLADRGATNWNDRSEKWHDRGTEQAAEIMTWGLMDQEIGFLAIHDTTCERLHTGFVLLTGAEPIAGLEHSCSASH